MSAAARANRRDVKRDEAIAFDLYGEMRGEASGDVVEKESVSGPATEGIYMTLNQRPEPIQGYTPLGVCSTNHQGSAQHRLSKQVDPCVRRASQHSVSQQTQRNSTPDLQIFTDLEFCISLAW